VHIHDDSIHVSMVSCTHTCVMVVWALHGGVHDFHMCIHDGSMHVVGIHDSQLCMHNEVTILCTCICHNHICCLLE
jgi:hypothetical protein